MVIPQKYVELLEGFTSAEFKRLGDFIRSPFFNKNKNLVTLFLFFEKAFDKSSIGEITKENLWHNVNPGERYNDSRARYLLSEFKRLCEEFLILSELGKNPVHQKNSLLASFSERNQHKNFSSLTNEHSEFYRNEFNRNYGYYINKIEFERTLITNKGRNIEKNLDKKYSELSDSIDFYFLSAKLDLINSLLSRKYHVLGNNSPDLKFTKEVISYIEENLNEIKKNNPVIYSEYLILMMMTSRKSDNFFNDLQSFVLKNITKYNHSELEQVYFPMVNYGFNKVALGENLYLTKLFDIYKTFEKKGFYNKMKFIQDIDFISIIMVGLHLKKIAWAEDFYEAYSFMLTPEFKEDTISLIKALISFKQRDYETSIQHINKVNYQNSYFYLKSKETLIQIYYEQKEFEALQSLIDSTKHYIKRRQNVLSIHFDRYTKFLRFVSMLLRANQKDKYEKVILKKELKENKNVIARDWLVEKVEEIS